MLVAQLSLEDGEALKNTQLACIKHRDLEIVFIDALRKEEYSGGGSIQSLIGAGRISSLTKNRLFDFYEYLRLIIN